jgi:limonene-1,2-epoxide hydrolase
MSPNPPASGNIAVVEAFLSAMEAQDLDLALSYLADDIVYQNVPMPADRGKPAVVRTLELFGRFVTGFEVRMINIAERDGVVLTERVDVLTGPMLFLDIWVCGTFEVRDGKITVWRDYFDMGSATLKLLASPVRALLNRR